MTGNPTLTLIKDGLNKSIPTDGSGRVSVTNVSSNITDDDSGLVCLYRSSRYFASARFYWQLHGVEVVRLYVDETEYLGWVNRIIRQAPYFKTTLKRGQDKIAVEGFFTCNYENKIFVSVGVLYPSE